MNFIDGEAKMLNGSIEKMYMNIHTGSIGDYESWDYQDEEGNWMNGVDRKEVVEIILTKDGEWIEA